MKIKIKIIQANLKELNNYNNDKTILNKKMID